MLNSDKKIIMQIPLPDINTSDLIQIAKIDWNRIHDILYKEVFDFTPGIGYEVIKKKYENPEKLIEWFKQTLENI